MEKQLNYKYGILPDKKDLEQLYKHITKVQWE